MKRFIFLLVAGWLCLSATDAAAQGWVQGLGERAVKRAKTSIKERTESKVDNKVDETVDKLFNFGKKKETTEDTATQTQTQTQTQTETQASAGSWICEECGKVGNHGNFCDDCGAKNPAGKGAATQTAKPAAQTEEAPQPRAMKDENSAYQKNDFLPCDSLIFSDPVEGEKIGQFPKKWDLTGGNAEVATLNGHQVIALIDASTGITPLIKEQDYLGNAFSIEFDFWGTEFKEEENIAARYYLVFNTDMYVRIETDHNGASFDIHWINGRTEKGANQSGKLTNIIKMGDWNHLAISFNEGELKVYVNGSRLVAVPNAMTAESFAIENDIWETRGYIKNVRIAQRSKGVKAHTTNPDAYAIKYNDGARTQHQGTYNVYTCRNKQYRLDYLSEYEIIDDNDKLVMEHDHEAILSLGDGNTPQRYKEGAWGDYHAAPQDVGNTWAAVLKDLSDVYVQHGGFQQAGTANICGKLATCYSGIVSHMKTPEGITMVGYEKLYMEKGKKAEIYVWNGITMRLVVEGETIFEVLDYTEDVPASALQKTLNVTWVK